MATGFTFGAKTTPAPAFGTGSIAFGTPAAAPTPAATQSQFGFGSLPASSSLFGTPASTTALGVGFKPTTTTTAATGFNLGGTSGFAFGTSASGTTAVSSAAPTTGLSFGTTTNSLNFEFGAAPTSAAPSLGLGFGVSTAAAATPPTFSLSFDSKATPAATTATPKIGLGGIAPSQSGSTSSNTQKEIAPKDQQLPNEFLQLVEQFKTCVQEEKNRSSEVSRCCVKEYHKVESELEAFNNQLNQLQNQVLANRFETEQIKYNAAKGLQNIEMAQRTHDTPPSLQFDNNAPLQFFLDLADHFEQELKNLKLKIENTEKFVKKTNQQSYLTSEDLALGLKKINEVFVALAGQMQTIHSQVDAQKEAFLNIRKLTNKDGQNPFEKASRNSEAISIINRAALKDNSPNLAIGPTPFNSIHLGSNQLNVGSQQHPQQPPPYSSAATSWFGLGPPTTTASSLLPSSYTFGTPTNQSTNFQLQKPPSGNKRGKQ